MKLIKTTKKLKNSREVVDLFTKNKVKDGIVSYKGGYAIVKNRRIVKIYVGSEALNKAKND